MNLQFFERTVRICTRFLVGTLLLDSHKFDNFRAQMMEQHPNRYHLSCWSRSQEFSQEVTEKTE
jgi:hypothetical protein